MVKSETFVIGRDFILKENQNWPLRTRTDLNVCLSGGVKFKQCPVRC